MAKNSEPVKVIQPDISSSEEEEDTDEDMSEDADFDSKVPCDNEKSSCHVAFDSFVESIKKNCDVDASEKQLQDAIRKLKEKYLKVDPSPSEKSCPVDRKGKEVVALEKIKAELFGVNEQMKLTVKQLEVVLAQAELLLKKVEVERARAELDSDAFKKKRNQ